MLHLYLFSITIFMLTALPNLLAICLHPSIFAAQDFLLLLIPILSIFLMQELTSIFTLSSLTLVNSKTLPLFVFPPAYDFNSFQKRSIKTPLMIFSNIFLLSLSQ